jgi:hypothetical protein
VGERGLQLYRIVKVLIREVPRPHDLGCDAHQSPIALGISVVSLDLLEDIHCLVVPLGLYVRDAL